MQFKHLTPESQAVAIYNVMEANPIETRGDNLYVLCEKYEFTSAGEIIPTDEDIDDMGRYDKYEGCDPEYYENL